MLFLWDSMLHLANDINCYYESLFEIIIINVSVGRNPVLLRKNSGLLKNLLATTHGQWVQFLGLSRNPKRYCMMLLFMLHLLSDSNFSSNLERVSPEINYLLHLYFKTQEVFDIF